MPNQQFIFERVRVVKVDFCALNRGQAAQVFIIGVMLEEGNAVWANALEDGLGDGGLSRSRATRNADNKWG
jgi:hypothetical protein